MKKLLLALTALTITHLSLTINEASAQTFQWATAAGSKNINNKADIPVDLATDANGNSYLLSNVHAKEIFVGSSSVPDGMGSETGGLTMLSSLDKNGKYRWSKIIGAAGTNPKEVKVVNDKVFMFGAVGTSTGYKAYYDKDYTTPSDYYSGMSLACYDTSGNFKWVIRPDSISVSDQSLYKPISFDIDEHGNSYMFISMPPGSKIVGSSITIPSAIPYKGFGFYLLKYNPSGSLLSVTMLKDFCYSQGNEAGVDKFKLTVNIKTNQFYVYGVGVPNPNSDTLFIKSKMMTNALFFAAFAGDGSYLWDKRDNLNEGGNIGIRGAKIDAVGDIIIGGSSSKNRIFNGYKFDNPFLTATAPGIPFIMKMSSSGSLIWCKTGGGTGPSQPAITFGFAGNAKYSSVCGFSGLRFFFGDAKDSIVVNTSTQDGWFAVIENTTGKTVKMGAARGDGFYDAVRAMSFSGDDLYIAGNFEGTKMVFDSSAVSVGPAKSGTDLFVAKMSTNKLSVEEASGKLRNIKIYPNPANDVLYIEQLQEGTEVHLFSMSGQQIYNGISSGNLHQLSVSGFALGIYILQLSDKDGEVYSTKIMKQ